jgi:intracellular sulfur oxidation DsrE/DsrF family protein
MKDSIILVSNYGMGNGDETLQLTLIANCFKLLLHNASLPSAICFYTDGVKRACEGSPVLEQLRELELRQVRLVICSTCLSYFALHKKVQVGVVGGMGDIIEAQSKAGKVISV